MSGEERNQEGDGGRAEKVIGGGRECYVGEKEGDEAIVHVRISLSQDVKVGGVEDFIVVA